MCQKSTTDDQLLAMIVARIVEVAQPEQIVLFGSRARGTHNADSDVDLLVIKDGEFHRRSLAQRIYRNLSGVGVAVDAIVVSSDDVHQYKDKLGTIIAPAMAEGRVIYNG